MKSIFVGSQDYGARCLKHLLDINEPPQAVFTFDPDKHEEWQNIFDEVLIGRNDIPIIKTRNLGANADFIKKMNPDVIFVIGWRNLIPENIYKLPKRGCIGVHGSLLPRYRGFAPLNWAIINGDKEIGISMFYIADGIDTGDVIAQKKMRIKRDDRMTSIKARFDDLIFNLFKEQYPIIKKGDVRAKKQDESKASYGSMRTPEDGEIDWDQSARKICDFILALGKPFPGAFTHLKDRKIWVWEARLGTSSVVHHGRPGTIIRISSEGVEVLAAKGTVILEIVQSEAGKESRASDHITSLKSRFINAHAAEVERLRNENEALKKRLVGKT